MIRLLVRSVASAAASLTAWPLAALLLFSAPVAPAQGVVASVAPVNTDFATDLDTDQDGEVHFATNNSGVLVAVWARAAGANSRIYSATSPDLGRSWAPPVAVSPPDTVADQPRIATNARGQWVAVYRFIGRESFDVATVRSVDNGGSWVPVQNTDTPELQENSPDVISDGASRFAVAFASQLDDSADMPGDIQAAISDTNGASFEPPVTFSDITIGGRNLRPRLAFDADQNTIRLAWLYSTETINAATAGDIYAAQLPPAALAFESVQLVTAWSISGPADLFSPELSDARNAAPTYLFYRTVQGGTDTGQLSSFDPISGTWQVDVSTFPWPNQVVFATGASGTVRYAQRGGDLTGPIETGFIDLSNVAQFPDASLPEPSGVGGLAIKELADGQGFGINFSSTVDNGGSDLESVLALIDPGSTQFVDLQAEWTNVPVGPVITGATFSSTLNVSNNGTTSVFPLRYIINLDQSAGNVINILPSRGSVVFNFGSIEWTVDDAPVLPGEVISLTIDVESIVAGTFVADTVDLSSGEGTDFSELTPSDNDASLSVPIEDPIWDGAITGSASPSSAVVDDLVVFTYVVRNLGNQPISDPSVAFELPSNVELLDSTPSGVNYDPSTFTGDYVFGGLILQAGETTSIVLRTRVLSSTSLVSPGFSVSYNEREQDVDFDNNSGTLDFSAELRSSDMGVSITGPAASIILGQNASFSITVTNSGPDAALTTTLQIQADGVPAEEVVIPALASGASTIINRTYTPAVIGAYNVSASVENAADENDLNDSASALVLVNPAGTPNLEAAISAAPNPLPVGQVVTFTITARNIGTLVAANSTLVHTLPDGFTLLSSTTSQGSRLTSGQQTTFSFGSIAVGGSATGTITARASTIDGAYSSSAVVAATGETDTSNNSASTSVQVQPRADLVATLSSAPASPFVNQEFIVTFSLVNNGPQTATSPTAAIVVPVGLEILSAEIGNGFVEISDRTINGFFTQVQAGGANAQTLSVRVRSPNAGPFDFTGSAFAGTPLDSNTGNNAASLTVRVQPPPPAEADLAITLGGPQFGRPAQVVTVPLSVSNQTGSADIITSVVVNVFLPVGLQFAGGTPTGFTEVAPRQFQRAFLQFTAPDTLNVSLSLAAAAAGNYTVFSTVSSAVNPDPISENNIASMLLRVTDEPISDLVLSGSYSLSTGTIGATSLFVLSVNNAGPDVTSSALVTGDFLESCTILSVDSSRGNATFTSNTFQVDMTGLEVNNPQSILVQVVPLVEPSLTLEASVSGPFLDPTPANNVTSLTQPVVPVVLPVIRADVGVQHIIAPERPQIGQPFFAVVAVANFGAEIATDVRLQTNLPADFQVQRISAPVGIPASIDASTNRLDAQFGFVSPGQFYAITLQILPVADRASTTTIFSVVSTLTPDSNSSNNTLATVVGIDDPAIGARPPDLTGKFLRLAARQPRRPGANATAGVEATIELAGIGKLLRRGNRPVFVDFYVSDDASFSELLDTRIRRMKLGRMPFNSTATRTFKIPMISLEPLRGKYIIAVLDSTNAVAETRKDNNILVVGPVAAF